MKDPIKNPPRLKRCENAKCGATVATLYMVRCGGAKPYRLCARCGDEAIKKWNTLMEQIA